MNDLWSEITPGAVVLAPELNVLLNLSSSINSSISNSRVDT